MAGEAKNASKGAAAAKESSPVAAGATAPADALNQPASDAAEAAPAAPQEAPAEATEELPDPPMYVRVLEAGTAVLPDQGGRITFEKGREFVEWDFDWQTMARQGVKLEGFFPGSDGEPIDLNDFVNSPDEE
jgi:hypothetical protein